jgi:hypothetical protein
LTINEDANMLIYNLSETIHNTWLQKFVKKAKIFYAIIDDLIRVLEHQTLYRMHLMAKLRGT